jgi:hypothetical protein
MSERLDGEYDVVSFRLRPGLLSLLCALLPLAVGWSADELPFLLGGRLRPYYSHVFLASLGSGLAGVILGAVAMRRPESRATGRLGVVVNATVLILLGLFLMIFRWIRWGLHGWF